MSRGMSWRRGAPVARQINGNALTSNGTLSVTTFIAGVCILYVVLVCSMFRENYKVVTGISSLPTHTQLFFPLLYV